MKSRKATFKGRRVWDILISQEKLTHEQLRHALEVQRTDRRELGKVLVSLGFISEEDLAQAQAERLGIEYVDLSVEHVDRGAIGLIDREVLREHGAIPLWIEDRCMVVAISNPTNPHAVEDLKNACGYLIVSVVATETRVRQVQDEVLPAGSRHHS